MPGDDRTRRLSGATARLLPSPGEAIVRQPEIIDEVPADPGTSGITPPTILESTPLASGTTPREEREASQSAASSAIRASSEEEAGTGRSSPGSIPREGLPPHFFSEQTHQVFYHDAIVYIEGEDVSPFLTGTIAVTYGFGADFNKCDFTLDNAGHRFTLTPENLRGVFRTSSPITSGGAFDYDESIKSQMYAKKSDLRFNPVDPESGGRRFPLHMWSTVFHKHDAVRVWIHNPASDRDEWIPAFTGFVIAKPMNEDYLTGLNNVSVSCADIRSLMANMRVNTNTMLCVAPGSSATDAADPTNALSLTGQQVWRNFSEQGNREFNSSFFAQLVVSSSLTNPWSALSLPEMISALTFLPGQNPDLFNEAAQRAMRSQSGNRDRAREEAQRAAEEIEPLQARVAVGGEGVLSPQELDRYHALRSQLENSGLRSEDQIAAVRQGEALEEQDATATEEAATASSPADVPGGARPAPRRSSHVGVHVGAGRIGRMRPGVFPFYGSILGDPPRPYASENRFPSGLGVGAVRTCLSKWYSLCMFGTPVRHNFVPQNSALYGRVEDAAPDYSARNRRYWTEAECREAGRSTRREGAWHPEAQGVHYLSPGINTPLDNISESQIIEGTAVAANLNWTNRLQLLTSGCETADYRFWVSGCGDLVFEFAQYDFSPEDYGGWSSVLTLDHHLLNESFDEEGGEVVTGVLANGSFIALGGIAGDDGTITNLYPGRSVGIWSPNLASRLGLNLKVLTFAQVTDLSRLEQLATLEFQKLLASADKYQIGHIFRPWLTLNRPIFNAYRERIALVDGISWTLPVTAGQVAGQQPPSMNITLNYTRTYDEVGLPRYITGGPSNPMYFGVPAVGPVQSVRRNLTARVDDFRRALTSLSSAPLTSETLSELRLRYRGVIPENQSFYNVIDATFRDSAPSPGEENPIVTGFRALEASLANEPPGSGGATEDQTRAQLRDIEARAEALQQSIREQESASGSSTSASSSDVEHNSAGVRPFLNGSGVRSTLGPSSDYEPTNPPPQAEEPSCSPGDPRFYSAPTAPTNRIIPLWNNFTSSIRRQEGSNSAVRQRFLSYANGTTPDSDIPRSAGTFQFANEFPRVVTSGFGLRPTSYYVSRSTPAARIELERDLSSLFSISSSAIAVPDPDTATERTNATKVRGASNWHPGADIPLDIGAEVYAVADGIVYFILQNTPRGNRRGQGMVVGIMHAEGYVTHYNHQRNLAEGIEVGALVKRNQVISYCGPSGSEQGETQTHLHLETGAIAGSNFYRTYVGPDKMWEVYTPARVAELRREIENAPDAASRALLLSQNTTRRIIGSGHLIFGHSISARPFLSSLSNEVVDRFDLGFLRRNGSFVLPSHRVLHYSPVPTTDPFASASNPSTNRSRDNVISLEAYFNLTSGGLLGGFKGVPALLLPAEPTRFTPIQPVPALPDSGTVDSVTFRRKVRERNAIIAANARSGRDITAHNTRRNAQLALFANEIPPNECPPSRYEGNIERQAGEPLPGQRRLTNESAEAARRGTR